MNDDTRKALTGLYNELLLLQAEGKEEEAAELLKKRFAELPEEEQGDLISLMYLEALDRKVKQEDAIAAIQEAGLNALEDIEKGEQGGATQAQ